MEISSLPPEIYQYCIESVYQPRREWRIDHFEMIEQPGMYNVNSGMIAFINEQGHRFESPFLTRVENILKEHGYMQNGMVGAYDFSMLPDELIPAPSYKDRWQLMATVAEAEEEAIEAQQEQAAIAQIASQKQIGEIDPRALETTVVLPKKGIAVSQNGTAPVQQIIPPGLGDMEELMGTYTTNNGHIIFVDQNGQSRVSEITPELTEALEQAGYKPAFIGVPIDDFIEFVTEPRQDNYLDDTVFQATQAFQQEWLVAKHIVEERKQLANNWDYQQEGGMSR